MQNSEYWKIRFGQLEAAQNQKGVDAYLEIEKIYRQAQKEIEGKINTWYQRFATNNRISMAEARKMLSGTDLKEFKWDVKDYIKYGQDNALMGGWMKELENASAKYHISKLEALKMQTQQSLEVMFSKQLGTVTGAMGDLFESGYYHTAYELQKGFNIGWDIAGLDQAHIEKLLSKPWAADGKNFSERIWSNKQKLISEIHNELTRNVMLGQDPQKAIDAIAKKMNTSKHNAGRLVMTEEAYFSSAAQKDCFNNLDVEEYEIVATLDSHTSDICQSLDGQVFPMKDFEPGVTAPPFHVNCVLPDSVVYAPDVEMLMQSDYSGNVIEVRTANGRHFTVTPNHIMLTARGWVRAKDIVKGDKVIYYCGWDKFIAETNPTDNHCVPTIENLFASFVKDGTVIPTTMPTTAEDFKGDAVENGKVNIIFVDSLLRDKFNPAQRKFFCDSPLIWAKFGDGEAVLSGNGTAARFLMCVGLSSDGIVGGGGVADIFFRSSLTHHELVRFREGAHYNARLFKTAFNRSCGDAEVPGKFLDTASSFIHGDDFVNREFPPCVRIADCDSVFIKDSHDWLSADTKDICDFGNTFAGIVEFDDVIGVKIHFYSGHVYDASSLSTLYYCNGFLSSNCRSTTVPHFNENFGQVGERAARDEDGNTYYIPDDMTYKEWKETFVDGGDKSGLDVYDQNGVVHYKRLSDTSNSGIINSDNWQGINYSQSYSKKTAISRLQSEYGIQFHDSKKYVMDDGLLADCVGWLDSFNDQYSGFMQKNPCKIPIIDNKAPSKMKKTVGYYSYYTNAPNVAELALNGQYHSDAAAFREYVEQCIKSKWYPQNATIHKTFVHEFGHHVSNSMRWMTNNPNWQHEFIQECIDDFKKIEPNYTYNNYIGMGDYVSRYGATSESELFAEAFAEYFGGENPREFAKIFGKKLDTLLKGVK